MPAHEDSESRVPLLQDDDLDSGESQLPRGDVESRELPKQDSSFVKRIWKNHRRRCAILLAASTATLVVLLVLILVVVLRRAPYAKHEETEEEDFALDPRLEKYQTVDDTLSCPDWAQIPGNSTAMTTSFNLPPSTNLTFFVTRGSPIAGRFIIHNERLGPSDDIKVDVSVRYDDIDEGRKEIQQSKACFAGQDHEQGVMLWADPGSTFSHLTFEVSMHLPDIQVFHDVSSDFTNSAVLHDMKVHLDIWRPTFFGVTRLAARNAQMDISALLSPAIYVQTTNAEIKGFFGVSEHIRIQTNKAPILGTIFTAGGYPEAETTLSIRNEDGPITAAISMASDFSHNKLTASLHTTNGELIIDTPRFGMSDKAVFLLDASTSNASAYLSLPPDFQGTFELSTTSGTASLLLDPDERDRNGQKRVVDMDQVNEKARKAGKVYWGEEPPKSEQGDIRLRTTQKNVTVSAIGPTDTKL